MNEIGCIDFFFIWVAPLKIYVSEHTQTAKISLRAQRSLRRSAMPCKHISFDVAHLFDVYTRFQGPQLMLMPPYALSLGVRSKIHQESFTFLQMQEQ